MNKFICKLFGHKMGKWQFMVGTVRERTCQRCGHIERNKER